MRIHQAKNTDINSVFCLTGLTILIQNEQLVQENTFPYPGSVY